MLVELEEITGDSNRWIISTQGLAILSLLRDRREDLIAFDWNRLELKELLLDELDGRHRALKAEGSEMEYESLMGGGDDAICIVEVVD